MEPQSEPQESRPFPTVLVILSFFVLLLAGAAAFLTYQNIQLKKQILELTSKPTPSPTGVPSETGTQTATANWKTYTNNDFGFLIKYPNNMFTISENYLTVDNKQTQKWEIHFSNKNKEETAKKGSDYSFYVHIDLQPKNRYGAPFSENDIKTVHQGDPEAITLVTFDGFKASKYSSFMSNPDGTKGSTISYYIFDGKRLIYLVAMSNRDSNFSQEKLDQILSTFKFTEQIFSAPTPTCRPRPACLDAIPPCRIPEYPDTCPRAVACTMDAKLCPDGSSVGRIGPNCEFAPCP